MTESYPFYFIQNSYSNSEILRVQLYRFTSSKTNRKYIVRVEVYRHNVYAVKFYPKSFADSKDKYRILTNDFEPRRIIMTCIEILKTIFETNPKSSFAFIGSNSLDEKISLTKRYRVYKTIVATRFGEHTFSHYFNESKSAYLLLRNTELMKNPSLLNDIQNAFNDIYRLLE